MSTRRSLKSPSPLPSAWKENFKTGCLERARRQRQDRVWRGRRHPTSKDQARHVVEVELRESGVAVESPLSRSPMVRLTSSGDNDLERLSTMEESMDQVNEEYILSEAEIYELMQEVEEELQQELQLMEEMELADMLERQHIEDQITEFEQWEKSHEIKIERDHVVCPICQNANLWMTDSVTMCPKYMDGECSFRLSTPSGLSLANLRDMLRLAYEEHTAECPSNGTIQFCVRNDATELIVVCESCGISNTII